VKQAILLILSLQVFDRNRLAMLGDAHQVMPLQDLVQHDAVE
jgi:hypothetical protein